MNEIVLSLDASSTAVGFCISQGSRYIHSGTYRPQGDQDERIHNIILWTMQMIETYHPDIIAVEEPMGHHSNLATDRLLARVFGALEATSFLANISFIKIHPMKIKATNFNKNACQAAAMLVGLSSVETDEADAIGIWQVVLGMLQARNFYTLIAQQETK